MMHLRSVFAGLCLTSLVASKATVYLIRHGEKPSSGNGLDAQGEQRAQCLRTVFGASSVYDIEHIMAETPKSGSFYITTMVSKLN
jgi:hypothetical protein